MLVRSKKILAVVLGVIVSFSPAQAFFSMEVVTAAELVSKGKFEEAIEVLKQCPEDVHCQAVLGNMYLAGQGVERSKEEAIKWYRKAAENGDLEWSAVQVSRLLQGQDLTPETKAEALMWLKKSALAGSRDATADIGDAYNEGKIVARNKATAYAFLKTAVDAHSFAVSKSAVQELWTEMNAKERKEAERILKKISTDLKSVVHSLK